MTAHAASAHARPLTREEEELAGLLGRVGLPRAQARCLALLVSRPHGCGAQDAAGATGLGRQDVGEAMRALAARGLARIGSVRRPEGGRPALRYHLGAPDALARLERERRAALEAELAALDALRARL